MNLNERISEIITYSKFTSSEFADEIEVQRSNISHITSGRNKPSLDFLIKIKNRFPELEWEWIISGDGPMMKKPEEEVVKPKAPTLPDLFSIISDDNFGKAENDIQQNIQTPGESDKSDQTPDKEFLSDSQRLEVEENITPKQTTESQTPIIKKIVWFYDNGKFESFEP